ncbi:citrate synthase [Phreatobacter aquaticus]|uniref:citrate synthase (unknown stereospecificity) n=1 Tax=Phreatobacter aquaticus TaxID=2570229 RepID=A0A4D7QTU7_9HYPH|nr:citrate synthase [Phreatobacter aquaticus]QCK88477.1 citrate synthase [Phreatobacter aquaticus]
MAGWITREEALHRLKVRPQTLYAYVSRGRVGTRPDEADPRRSQYSADDIAGLVGRRARGKRPQAIAASAIAWGEPIIETGISTVAHGRLFYRGRDAVTLAASASLEEVAALLWEAPGPVVFLADAGLAAADSRSVQVRAFSTLALAAAEAPPSLGRRPEVLRAEGAALVARLAAAYQVPSTSGVALHQRVAEAWSLSGDAADFVRWALVLQAEHELNASAFATRVAASTGAPLAACVLAGFSTLQGPLHGYATANVEALAEDARRLSVARVIEPYLTTGRRVPGFGHPLYPDGDPRAAALIERFGLPDIHRDLMAAVVAATGIAPNVDFALVALAERFGLPGGTAFQLFSMGRVVGWLAHAMEQGAQGSLIRPRGHYVGPPVEA